MMPESIVIVKWGKGYVAHLRYEDHKHDINISHGIKEVLYRIVEKQVRKVRDELQGIPQDSQAR